MQKNRLVVGCSAGRTTVEYSSSIPACSAVTKISGLVEKELDQHATVSELRRQREETLAGTRATYRDLQSQFKSEQQQSQLGRPEVRGLLRHIAILVL